MPGIQAVAYADWPLLDGYGFKTDSISIDGGPPSEVPAWFMNVSPGWLDTMKIPFISGRDFLPTDLSPGAAIVNEAFARQFFAHENPVGKWFEGTSGWMRGQKFQIVGLVHDARYRYLRQTVLPVAYTPFRRTDTRGTMQGGTLVVRTSTSNPLALASTLRNEIPRTRPEFRVSNMRTQQELIDSQTIRERLLAMLARFFGVVALLLAGVGLYGVLDYSVLQRRREIGIRMALGAQPRDLAVRVTARVFSMVLLGALTGLALGLASVRYIEPLLYQVRSTELPVLVIPVPRHPRSSGPGGITGRDSRGKDRPCYAAAGRIAEAGALLSFSNLEAESVLDLSRYFAVLHREPVIVSRVLHPSLVEHKKEVVPRPQDPAHAALPAQIARLVVVLDQIRKRKERRSRIVDLHRIDPGDEITLRQPGERLVA